MNFDALGNWKLIGSIATALLGCLSWLARHKASQTGSWLSRRLSVEKDLMIAQRTVANQEAEIAYLMAALGRAQESQQIVQAATTISALKSAKPSADSTPSPTGSRPPSARSSGANNPLEIPSIS